MFIQLLEKWKSRMMIMRMLKSFSQLSICAYSNMFGDYHDVSLKTNVLLSADDFENFRNMSK